MKDLILNIYRFLKPNLEAYIWIIALIYLMFINPYQLNHFSFCAFKLIGIDYCPGCGIGRSISMLYRGDIFGSINMHPLGIFALAIIFYRIVTLLQKNKIKLKLKRS
ncbi:MAG: DUF2752 domain-containing protein [Melioribacteraceae bacterium]